jgi:hypothetical protein
MFLECNTFLANVRHLLFNWVNDSTVQRHPSTGGSNSAVQENPRSCPSPPPPNPNLNQFAPWQLLYYPSNYQNTQTSIFCTSPTFLHNLCSKRTTWVMVHLQESYKQYLSFDTRSPHMQHMDDPILHGASVPSAYHTTQSITFCDKNSIHWYTAVNPRTLLTA